MFIVDQEYDSWQRKDLAFNVINKFFDSLNGSDLFGLIGLGKDSKRYGIMLEPKDRNLSVKKKILKSEMMMNNSLSVHEKQIFKRHKLEKALMKALSWQDKIDDVAKRINNHTYFGPHKWIVCLLGSDRYDVDNFI